MSTEITAPKSLQEQRQDFIRWQIVGKDITSDEFEYFIQVCQHLNLDPLRKQIYCIKRGQRATIQTAIDGFRLIATRTGELAGIDDAVFDVDDADHPNRALVAVYRMVQGQKCRFSATARWDEYRQVDSSGQLTAMWKKMPYLMLAKCAESLALRKAFPAELSGVYTDPEMMQADIPPAPLELGFRSEAALIKDEQRLPSEHQDYPAEEPATSDPQLPVNKQQKQSIAKLSIALGREEPSVEAYETMTFHQAGAYIRQLSRDYNESRRH